MQRHAHFLLCENSNAFQQAAKKAVKVVLKWLLFLFIRLTALQALWSHRSGINLVGNHIDIQVSGGAE